MKITIYIKSDKSDKSYKKLYTEYLKRLPSTMKISIKKIPKSINKKEGQYIIGINPSGKNLSSEEFSKTFYNIHDDRTIKEIFFVLDNSITVDYDEEIALTSTETSDDMKLVMLSEVLYRGWSINTAKSYHK